MEQPPEPPQSLPSEPQTTPSRQLWFEQFFDLSIPWARREALDPVPESLRGRLAIQLSQGVTIDNTFHRENEWVTLDDEMAFQRLVSQHAPITQIILPHFDRVIPGGLFMPEVQVPSRAGELKTWLPRLTKSLLVIVGCLTAIIALPKFGLSLREFGIVFAIIGIMFGVYPFLEAASRLFRRVDKLPLVELNRRKARALFFVQALGKQSNTAVLILVAAPVLVFLLQFSGYRESLFYEGALRRGVAAGWPGDLFRLLSHGALHDGIIHVAFNMIALWQLGKAWILMRDWSSLWTIFIGGIAAGGLASAWLSSDAPIIAQSVGASGGVMAVLGALVASGMLARESVPAHIWRSVLQMTLVMIIFGAVFSSFIDNGAHAGGFIFGFLLSCILARCTEIRGPIQWALSLVAVVSFALWLVVVGRMVYQAVFLS